MAVAPLTLLRLLQTADSSFPSGAFAFSSGLETLCNEARVNSIVDVKALVVTQVLPRWLEFDRVFLLQAHAAATDPAQLLDVDQQCHVQNTTDRLAMASRRIGRSLLSVHGRIGTPHVEPYRTALARNGPTDACGYEPVVQGLIGAGLGLSADETQAGALHSVIMAFLSAAIRLGKAGAIEVQALLAQISPVLAQGLARPAPARAGSFSPLTEIAATRRAATHAHLFAT